MAKADKEKGKQKNNGSGHHYSAQDIQVLEGLEPVRKRPGMYIGTTGPDGLHHLVWEIFDNSRDEAMGDFADEIEVVLLPGNRIRVVDNGRGIPVDMHKQTKVSALETIMTTLHAGGKFGGEGYKVSGGLHGVGASVVNALSVYTKVEVHRDGGKFVQEYARGKKKASVKKVSASKLHGTIVTFEPDTEIFPEVIFDWNRIVGHLRQQAYLVKGLRIRAIDASKVEGKIDLDSLFYFSEGDIEAPSFTFYFEGGLRSLIRFYNEFQTPIHKNVFYAEKETEGVGVEIAFQYVDDINSRVLAFANNIHTPEGGTHITGFKSGLTRTINAYSKKNSSSKDSEDSFTGDDVLEGLTAVISVKIREIQFEGQTKSKLGSVEARSATENILSEALSNFLEENPDDARMIAGKVTLAMKARKAAKAAKESVIRKGALEGFSLPGKLTDCQSRSPEESELFIVEGDSAGGCFSADTKVALVDGRELSFEELVREDTEGKQNYCYTMALDGSITVAPILHPRVTKVDASVVKVTLDTGEEIICTPDHRFMLRDGTYKKVADLLSEYSLMPLRRQLSRLGKHITIKGYELVYSPSESRWIFTHLLSDRYNLAQGVYTKESGTAVHHRDFNKRNNNPDNLVRLGKQEHLLFHTAHLEHTLHTPESKEKARQAHARPEYREKIRALMTTPRMRALFSARAKKQWEDAAYKAFMKERSRLFYEENTKYRDATTARLNNEQKKYWSNTHKRILQEKRVEAYFAEDPEKKLMLPEKAQEEWKSEVLLAWRR